jgi:Flp pilus assembly CpaE family ATPase
LQCCSAAIGRDALVDAGRLAGQQWTVIVPVLRAADQVLLAVRPTLRSVHAAQDTVIRLRYELGELSRVSTLVVGDGPYRAAEVATALEIRLAAQLPADRAAAGALSDGTVIPMKTLLRSPLLRAAAVLAEKLIVAADQAVTDDVAVSR